MFLNSCTYTDSCLGRFVREAKQKSWWKNTLVIVTADHGHRFPFNSAMFEKGKFKIPMLWLGGAVDSAMVVNKIGSQTDMANTLISQLNIRDGRFTFSRNILSAETKPLAVYSFNNGFGYISPTMETVYDFDLHNYLQPMDNAMEKDLRNGKAYMQMLFNDYNQR